MRCGGCGQPGHNIRPCKSKKRKAAGAATDGHDAGSEEHDEAVRIRKADCGRYNAACRDPVYLAGRPRCCGRRRFYELQRDASRWGRLAYILKRPTWAISLRGRERAVPAGTWCGW